MSLLHGIHSPEDLKQIRVEDLPLVAEELRENIIAACAKNGGHLGGSLGTVDLIIALHYAFHMPKDKIVFDVGHQAYAHKALTGRKDRLMTIRQKGGLSGFPKRDESPYDTFGTAHASTGISSALGIKIAKTIKNEDDHVIVVVGDGGLTGGMAYEGLNQCGHLKKNLIVVLNDNGMSISQNVGAISQFLTKRVTSDVYNKVREELKHVLTLLSEHGVPVLHPVERIRKFMKSLFPSGIFFESLGFRYLGPFDGHNLSEMIDVFKNAKTLSRDNPLLIHVITQKGKGYPMAEKNPVDSHGVSPFDPITGKSLPKKPSPPSYTTVFAKTLTQLAKTNDKIMAITAAMPEGTGLDLFAKEFPNRMFDVGIAEQHAVVFAAGMATEGLQPACAIYSTFLQRAFDPIIHDVALQRLPVRFFLDRGGFVGADGATHHGVFDISYLRCIPNMVLMAPKDENELQHMIKTSFDVPLPTTVRYPRGNGYGVKMDEALKSLPIGKGEMVFPEFNNPEQILTTDLAFIAIGTMVQPCVKAAQILAEEGLSCSVMNARFIKPLDEELILKLAEAIPTLITVEENVLAGGFGSSILELFAKKGIQKSIFNIGIPDRFFDHATPEELKSEAGLDAVGIVKFVREKVRLPKTKVSPLRRIESVFTK